MMERERCPLEKLKHLQTIHVLVPWCFPGVLGDPPTEPTFSGHNHSSLGWSYMNKLSMDPCGLLNWFNHRLHLMARILKSIGRLGQYVDGFPGIYHVSDAGQEMCFCSSFLHFHPAILTSFWWSSQQIQIITTDQHMTKDDCHGGCVPLHCSVPGPRGTEKKGEDNWEG